MLILFFVFVVLLLYFVIKILRNEDSKKQAANSKEREDPVLSYPVIQSENLSAVGNAGENAVSSVLKSLPPEYIVLNDLLKGWN